MTTVNVKEKCYICDKEKVLYVCKSCSQNFCVDDIAKHHQSFCEKYHEFQIEYDQFRQKLIQQQENSKNLPLLQQVNQWEDESIIKIKQTAKECRDIVIKHKNQHIADIEIRLTRLAYRIQAVHHENEINLNRLKTEFKQLVEELDRPLHISIQHEPSSFISKISIDTSLYIAHNSRWAQNGMTVAGGHGKGEGTNQLNDPCGLYVDEDQTIFIADWGNHRIVKWKLNAASGQVVAGGNGQGNRSDQLDRPTDVIFDKQTDNLFICDRENRRVIQWSCQNDTTKGEVILENMKYWGIAMDDQRRLYVSDCDKQEVRRYQIGENNGILVAGGNGQGDQLDQFNFPSFIFVDHDYSVYVSDYWNHRVMKWMTGATEGIIVAGGQGQGNALIQLSYPNGLFVDSLGAVYVAENGNNRVTRWRKGATQGEVIVDRNGEGEQQLYWPYGMSVDRYGHLYIVDCNNFRVQRFSIETS